MADNTSIVQAKSGSPVLRKILKKLTITAHGGITGMKRLKSRMWYCDEAPTVDAASQATYPITKGELIYDKTNDDAYICTVSPAASTAGTFVKMNA